ncbi:MAG: GntR family transcriptional regulator [Rhodospirillaceae bacterium]|nr:GntR family transcriptional regulator [Rhodospirillaceae bacterium]
MKPANSAKLDRRSLDWRAADLLREQILSGELPHGHRLVETSLAEQLEVSRGTLRSALRTLSYEGLIDQVAYTKWIVPERSHADAWELYTLRGSLEGLAARLVTERQRPDAINSVRAAFDRLVKAVAAESHSAVAEADAALHKTIIVAAGHRRLLEQYQLLEQQIRHYIIWSNAMIVDLHQMVPAHQPLVAAIVGGDVETAARLGLEHNAPEVDKAAGDMAQHEINTAAPNGAAKKSK